jgi:hypothetical protein
VRLNASPSAFGVLVSVASVRSSEPPVPHGRKLVGIWFVSFAPSEIAIHLSAAPISSTGHTHSRKRGYAGSDTFSPLIGVRSAPMDLVVQDAEAGMKFWTMLGGTPTKLGVNEPLKFPGVLILLRKGEPSGGSVGSVVSHMGFMV